MWGVKKSFMLHIHTPYWVYQQYAYCTPAEQNWFQQKLVAEKIGWKHCNNAEKLGWINPDCQRAIPPVIQIFKMRNYFRNLHDLCDANNKFCIFWLFF